MGTIDLSNRFRGYLPVVVDVETGGLDSLVHPLLQVAAVALKIDENGTLVTDWEQSWDITPYTNAPLDPESLKINRIDPWDTNRNDIPEREALQELFRRVSTTQKAHDCTRSILIGHNSAFDLRFIHQAATRSQIKRVPFHPFSSLDTCTLAAVACGQTVLAQACIKLGIDFDNNLAHEAVYDARKTAELFCLVVNRWGLIPLPQTDQID